ncbi:MAG: tetratricopeptide repeat protein [Chitinophagaceae bacterium]|nr:tetratricopeptide repeat protein [Chitinophagaceae bacterium]
MTEKHVESNEALARVQGFWERFQKPVLIAVTAIVVIVGGWYAYNEYIVKPKEEKAADAMFRAQQYFAMDSSNLVLNGDGQSRGVLYVINNFSGTKEANLAKYYAGISYLKLGQFENAVKYLKDFSTDASQIQLMAYGALGDAYSELNKKDEAIASYQKAAAAFDKDDNNSSEYLFRAALLAETTGNSAKALELYKELKDKFPRTEKGFQADKYIYRLSIEKN